jgi:hypothetical protein
LAESSSLDEALKQPPAGNEAALDLPLPLQHTRNYSLDVCLVVLHAVHDASRRPRDRLRSTERGLYSVLCGLVQKMVPEDLPYLLSMLASAAETLGDLPPQRISSDLGASTETDNSGPASTPVMVGYEAPLKQYVTLDQIAAVVNRSKRSLERYKTRKTDPLPTPDVEGGGGKPAEWDWENIRPWLEREFGRTLPKRYPSLRH